MPANVRLDIFDRIVCEAFITFVCHVVSVVLFPGTSTPVGLTAAGVKVIAYFYNHRATVKL